MRKSIPTDAAAPKRRIAGGRWVLLVIACGVATGLWWGASPREEQPISRAEFASPLRVEARTGDGSDTGTRFYRERLSVADAVQEYSNLSRYSVANRGYIWFNELDATLHGLLSRFRLRRGVERLSRLELPEGYVEFPKAESELTPSLEAKPFAAGLSLAPPVAGMSIQAMNWSGAPTGASTGIKRGNVYAPPPGFVSTSPSERILQLWAALRNRGVELKPVEPGHRLKVVWHRRLKEEPAAEKSSP